MDGSQPITHTTTTPDAAIDATAGSSNPPPAQQGDQKSNLTRSIMANTFYGLFNTALKLHTAINPDAGDMGGDHDFGDHDGHDDHDDDYNHDDDHLDDDLDHADIEHDIEDMKEGDEPMPSEQSTIVHALPGLAVGGAGALVGTAVAAASGGDNKSRDPLSPKQAFVPEAVPSTTAPAALAPTPAATKTTSIPSAPVKPKVDPLAPSAAAPFGYKMVTVKKPDGTIAKVRRPLKEGETPPAPTPPKTADKTSTDPEKDTSLAIDTNLAAPATAESADKRAVQVTEKELTSPSNPTQATHAADKYKGARTAARILKFLFWIVAISFPLFFLALAIVTACLSQHPISIEYNLSTKKAPLTEAITVAASAWPIVFAAVVAQSLKMYAAYRVERGIRLMTLEQLISSPSVGGAIKQPFMLRTLNWTTFALFFIWALSPLAGQAILRMSDVVPTQASVESLVPYFSSESFDIDGKGNSVWIHNPWSAPNKTTLGTAILTATILDYTQNENFNHDIYNNLRTPLLQNDFAFNFSELGSDGATAFASLLGSPYWINDEGYADQNTSFSLNASYFTFDCSPFQQVDAFGEELRRYNLALSLAQPMAFSALNNTVWTYTNYTSNGTAMTWEFDQPDSSGVLYFAVLDDWTGESLNGSSNTANASFSMCNYTQVVSNTSWSCSGVAETSLCSPYDSVEIPFEVLNETSINMPLGYWFPYAMQQLAVPSDAAITPLIASFIADPYFGSHQEAYYSTGHYINTNDVLVPMSDVSPADISHRLGLIANTLFMLELQPQAFVSTDSSTWNNSIVASSSDSVITTAPYSIYEVHWPWLIVLLVCSSLLLIAGIAAAIWESQVIGPDFLGFANTAVKRSVRMPKTLSTMNARDRLHALHETEVLLQDARPDHPIGRIVLGVKDDQSSKLRRGREYK